MLNALRFQMSLAWVLVRRADLYVRFGFLKTIRHAEISSQILFLIGWAMFLWHLPVFGGCVAAYYVFSMGRVGHAILWDTWENMPTCTETGLLAVLGLVGFVQASLAIGFWTTVLLLITVWVLWYPLNQDMSRKARLSLLF